MKIELPLSVEQQQAICDDANPLVIPALIDALDRAQNALSAIRKNARNTKGEFSRYVIGVVNQVMLDG